MTAAKDPNAKWAKYRATMNAKRAAKAAATTQEGTAIMTIDTDQRAWDLYLQLQQQRASLKTYEQALQFVRVRQMEATDTVKPIADKLWQIAERMRGNIP